MREHLQLLAEAVPLVVPAGAATVDTPAARQMHADSSNRSSNKSNSNGTSSSILSRMSDRVAAWFSQDDDQQLSLWVARCVSDVNQTTLRPVDLVHCTVHVRGREGHVGGTFFVEGGRTPLPEVGLGQGPLVRFLQQLLGLMRKSRSNSRLLHALGLLGQLAVPTFGLRQLQQLQQQLGVLELEFDVKVLMLHVMGESAEADEAGTG